MGPQCPQPSMHHQQAGVACCAVLPLTSTRCRESRRTIDGGTFGVCVGPLKQALGTRGAARGRLAADDVGAWRGIPAAG